MDNLETNLNEIKDILLEMGLCLGMKIEGFDPSSDEYYQEIDKRMVENFPHKFNVGEVSQTNNVQENVAAPSRGARGKTGKGRTVKLSPSQVAIAKRLGVPLEAVSYTHLTLPTKRIV